MVWPQDSLCNISEQTNALFEKARANAFNRRAPLDSIDLLIALAEVRPTVVHNFFYMKDITPQAIKQTASKFGLYEKKSKTSRRGQIHPDAILALGYAFAHMATEIPLGAFTTPKLLRSLCYSPSHDSQRINFSPEYRGGLVNCLVWVPPPTSQQSY